MNHHPIWSSDTESYQNPLNCLWPKGLSCIERRNTGCLRLQPIFDILMSWPTYGDSLGPPITEKCQFYLERWDDVTLSTDDFSMLFLQTPSWEDIREWIVTIHAARSPQPCMTYFGWLMPGRSSSLLLKNSHPNRIIHYKSIWSYEDRLWSRWSRHWSWRHLKGRLWLVGHEDSWRTGCGWSWRHLKDQVVDDPEDSWRTGCGW
jgi:hypothetical protein